MPKFELTSPDGKKYQVEGPEGATPEQAYDILQQQLKGQSGNTRGGDLARGLLHGATMGMAGEPPAKDASGWRTAGEEIGDVGTSMAAGLIPGGMVAKGAIGAGLGALQPADSWSDRAKNAAIGGGSAMTGGVIGKMPRGVKTALDTLAEMGIGGTVGHQFGNWGTLSGALAGPSILHRLGGLTGGRGLGDLIAAIANNPGLASYIGIKAAPGVEQAGSFVGDQLGKTSQ
jgi:hypothetical protein